MRSQLVPHAGRALTHVRVPEVLDGVIGTAQQTVGELGPLIQPAMIEDKQDPALLDRPFIFLQQRISLVVPPFSTLLACAFWYVHGDFVPVLWANLCN